MYRCDIKPLSVNEAWLGRKRKSAKYRKYEAEVTELLATAEIEVPPTGGLGLCLEFGFSSSASDIDNPIKPFQDILQKVYGFDDKRIHELIVHKTKVKRGEEYILFDLYVLED